MATTETKENVETLKEELENVKNELEQCKQLLAQYEEAYKLQCEKYSNLFGIYANTVDYTIANTVRKGN